MLASDILLILFTKYNQDALIGNSINFP